MFFKCISIPTFKTVQELQARFPQSTIIFTDNSYHIYTSNATWVADINGRIFCAINNYGPNDYDTIIKQFSVYPEVINIGLANYIIDVYRTPTNDEDYSKNLLKNAIDLLIEEHSIAFPPHVLEQIEDNAFKHQIKLLQLKKLQKLQSLSSEDKQYITQHEEIIKLLIGLQDNPPLGYEKSIELAKKLTSSIAPSSVAPLMKAIEDSGVSPNNLQSVKMAMCTVYCLTFYTMDEAENALHSISRKYNNETGGRISAELDGKFSVQIIDSIRAEEKSYNFSILDYAFENINWFTKDEISELIEKGWLKIIKDSKGGNTYCFSPRIYNSKNIPLLNLLNMEETSKEKILEIIKGRCVFHTHPQMNNNAINDSRNLPSPADLIVQMTLVIDDNRLDAKKHKIFTPDFVLTIQIDDLNLPTLINARAKFIAYENLGKQQSSKLAFRDICNKFINDGLDKLKLDYSMRNLPIILQKIFGYTFQYKKITSGDYQYNDESIKISEYNGSP